MDKFFESYRNKAEAERGLPFKEADWNLLDQKLRRENSMPLPFFVWPLIAGLSTAALLFFLWTGTKLKTINNTSEPSSDSMISHPSTILQDTIYIERPVYITRIVNKYIDKSLSKTSTPSQLAQKNQSNQIAEPGNLVELEDLTSKNTHLQQIIENQSKRIQDLNEVLNKYSDIAKKPSNVHLIDGNEVTDTSQASVAGDDQKNKDSSAPISTNIAVSPSAKDLEVPIAVSLPLAGDTLSKWQKFVRTMTPVGLDLNVQGGMPFLLHHQIHNQYGYLFRSKANLVLRSGMEIQAGLTYSKFYYETSMMDERLGAPHIDAPLNDFKFFKVEVQRPSINVDLGLYYNLIQHRRLTPIVGMGLGYNIPLESKLGYDFVSTNPPLEYPFDTLYTPKIITPYTLQWHGGIKYAINRRWSFAVNTTVYNKLSKNDLLSSRVDLYTGIIYRLY